MKKINLDYKKTIIICLLIIVALVFIYGGIIQKNRINKKFAEDMVKISESNVNKVFSIQKIILCSNANAIDNSEKKDLTKLNIYQYTDIAIYLNNKNTIKELTKENTISELYIDNISIETSSDKGKQSLRYKNLLGFGSKEDIGAYVYNDRIDFNIINTNKENEKADYNKPNFFTDCSNPITLEYINQDLMNDYKLEEGSSISFDGKILKSAGIKIEDINCKIKFKINIKNNQDETYSCWVNFQIPLEDLYEGNSIKSKVLDENDYKYDFFKI